MSADVLQIHANIPVVSRFRVHHLAEELDLLGVSHATFTSNLVPIRREERRQFLAGSRLLLLHRLPYSANLERLIEEARDLGIRVLFECDDMIFVPDLDPRWVHGVTYLSGRQQQEYFIDLHGYAKLLSLCDGAVVSTTFLAACVHAVGKPAFLLRNALDQASIQCSKAARSGEGGERPLTIMYASGSRTHDRDFQEFSSALQSVLEANKSARLHLLGYLELDHTWEAFQGQIVRTGFLPYDDYFQLLADATLCLAPLEAENPFCRAKSELKFIEAGAWGVPVLATRAGGFAEAIEHGVDGFLAGGSSEQFELLDAVAKRPELARAAGTRARAKVLKHYTTAARSADLKRLLRQMAN